MSRSAEPTHPSGDRDAAPLRDTLRRLDPLVPGQSLRHGAPDGPHWTSLDTMLDHSQVRGALDGLTAYYQAGHDRLGTPLAAHALISRLALPAAAMGAAVFALRRLPLPRLADLSVRWHPDAARIAEIAFADAELLVLPDDELGRAAGVRVVPDVATLQKELLAAVYEVYRPLVELISQLGHRGLRALWQVVSDRVAAGPLRAGRLLGDEARAKAEVQQLLTTAAKPLFQEPVWLDVHDGEHEHVFKQLSVCCLAYKSSARPEQYCLTCPLLSPEDIEKRLHGRLVKVNGPAPGSGRS